MHEATDSPDSKQLEQPPGLMGKVGEEVPSREREKHNFPKVKKQQHTPLLKIKGFNTFHLPQKERKTTPTHQNFPRTSIKQMREEIKRSLKREKKKE